MIRTTIGLFLLLSISTLLPASPAVDTNVELVIIMAAGGHCNCMSRSIVGDKSAYDCFYQHEPTVSAVGSTQVNGECIDELIPGCTTANRCQGKHYSIFFSTPADNFCNNPGIFVDGVPIAGTSLSCELEGDDLDCNSVYHGSNITIDFRCKDQVPPSLLATVTIGWDCHPCGTNLPN